MTDPDLANNSATDTDTLTPQADLSITKTDSVTTAVPGTTTTYKVVVSNQGSSAVNGASVSDPLPAGVTAATWAATASSGGGVVTGPVSGTGALATTVDLPVGGSVTFTFTVQIAPSATGSLSNTATITPPAGTTDSDLADNSATDTDSLTPQADLSITKTDGILVAIPGTSTTYTIVVRNDGPSTAVNQAVTDVFPSAITGVSWTAVASAGSSVAAASGTGNINTTVTLLSGGTVTFTAVAQISPDALREVVSLVNSATVAVPPGDTTPGNNSATDTDSLTPLAGLSITKTDGQTTAVPGTSTSYTITVSNAGPSAANGVALSDPLPAGVTAATWSFTGATGGGVVTGPSSGTGALATTVNLPVGATITFTFTVQIDPLATGSLVNTATATPSGGAPAGVTDTDSLTPQADLVVTKTDGQTSAVPGTPVTYTIVVSNQGPSTVSSLTLTDTVPADLLNPSFGTPSAGSYNPATGVWSGLSLATGQSVSITLTGTIDPAATATLTNTAHVAPPAGVTDPDLTDNNASDTDSLTPQADLVITKTDGVTSAVPGTSTTYTVVVSNEGPSAVSGASVSDPLPAGVVAGAWTATASSGGGTVTGPVSGTGALATTVDLPVDASVTFTFTVLVSPSATGSLSNTATITPPAGVTDLDLTDNSATDTDSLTPQADLSITKTDGVLAAIPGTSTTYTIVVNNSGPSTAVNQAVTDVFPSEITGVSWTAVASAGSSVAQASGTGNINTTVTLLPGGTVTFTAVAQISPSATGSLTNTATVAAPPGDATADNSATDTDSLTPLAGLTITKDDGKTTVVPGTSTTYTITVGNSGPSDVVGAALSDPLPAGVTAAIWAFAGATGGGTVSGPSSGTGALATTVNLPVGATITFTFTVQVASSATGSLVNTATATPPGGTPASVTDTDSLTPEADLSITKTDGQTSAIPGTKTTYTIVVTNAGPSAATNVLVTDSVPAGLTGVTWTSVGSAGVTGNDLSGSGNINDTVTFIPVGGTVTYTLTGTIDPAATGTLTNTAHVSPPAGVTDPDLADNNASDTDTLTPSADLSITKTDGQTSAVPGTTTTYTIVVSNDGPSTVSNLTLTDAVPAALLNPSFGGGAVSGPGRRQRHTRPPAV